MAKERFEINESRPVRIAAKRIKQILDAEYQKFFFCREFKLFKRQT